MWQSLVTMHTKLRTKRIEGCFDASVHTDSH